MAVPTIVSMLSTSMYNLADTYFVSSINTQSVAAVGISFCMMAVIQAVGFFFGHGSGNYISRRLGAKDTDSARKMAATGVVLSFISGLCITILGLSFLTPLSLLLGSTPTILPYTERYLGIILLGAPMMTMSLTLNNQMRFQGNTMYAMKGILSGVLLNLVLAPTLILYFCLGITGAARAKEQTSAHAWHISTPRSPKQWGRMMMSGMKKRPLLAAATRLARMGFLMVCVSILVNTMKATSGKLSTCQRRAAVPTLTTSFSSLKRVMMDSAETNPATAQTVRKIVPHLIQKVKASFTRL